MNGRNEELLSAYFDGELTGDEKTRVEQLLADDLAARELLNEVSEVSALVRSLPRPVAPPELRDAVLARVRATPAVAAGAPVRRPSRRHSIRWIAGTAAGLLTAVLIYRANLPVDEDQSAGTTITRSDQGANSERAEGLAARIPADPVEVAYLNTGAMLDEFAKSLESGATPVPGEVLHDVAQVGEQVLCIQYRVVDTQDLQGQIQVILSQNGITRMTDDRDAATSFARFDSQPSGQLEAIYLEAPVTNFTSAVAQISDLDDVTLVTTNTFSFSDTADDSAPAADRFYLEKLAEQPVSESSPADAAALGVEGRDGDGVVAESVAGESQARQFAEPAPLSVPTLLAPTEEAAAQESRDLNFRRLSDQTPPRASDLSLDGQARGEAAGVEEASRLEQNVEWDDAYQVPVPVPATLSVKLQEKEALLFDVDGEAGNDHLNEAEVEAKAQSRQRIQNWHYAAPVSQSPAQTAAPNRVRVVILLVPEKGE